MTAIVPRGGDGTPDLSTADRLVVLVLLDQLGDGDGRPSVYGVCRQTGLAPRTVMRSLRRIEAAGVTRRGER